MPPEILLNLFRTTERGTSLGWMTKTIYCIRSINEKEELN